MQPGDIDIHGRLVPKSGNRISGSYVRLQDHQFPIGQSFELPDRVSLGRFFECVELIFPRHIEGSTGAEQGTVHEIGRGVEQEWLARPAHGPAGIAAVALEIQRGTPTRGVIRQRRLLLEEDHLGSIGQFSCNADSGDPTADHDNIWHQVNPMCSRSMKAARGTAVTTEAFG